MNEELKRKLLEGGIDVDGILARLPGREELIIRLLCKFPEEKCYCLLEESLKNKDYNKAFENAHNLKGITANLDMHRLYELTCVLVEKLRANQYDGVEGDFEGIKDEYEKVVAAINTLL